VGKFLFFFLKILHTGLDKETKRKEKPGGGGFFLKVPMSEFLATSAVHVMTA